MYRYKHVFVKYLGQKLIILLQNIKKMNCNKIYLIWESNQLISHIFVRYKLYVLAFFSVHTIHNKVPTKYEFTTNLCQIRSKFHSGSQQIRQHPYLVT